MKKILSIFITISFVLSIVACGNNESKVTETETEPPRLSYELALVMGPGSLEEGKENGALWDGIVKYAEEKNKLYKSFQAPDTSTIEIFTKIEVSIADGARVVACIGEEFAEAVYYAAQSYPEVHFVIFDGSPHNTEKDVYKVGINTISVLYDGETEGLIRKTINDGGNSQISSKLTETIYGIIKDHYNGKFDGGSKKPLQ